MSARFGPFLSTDDDMRLFLGSQRHDWMEAARTWFASPTNVDLLVDIFMWAKRQEQQRNPRCGNCVLFVESELPGFRQRPAAQVNFVVAFATRVALCKVRNHRSFSKASSLVSESDTCFSSSRCLSLSYPPRSGFDIGQVINSNVLSIVYRMG